MLGRRTALAVAYANNRNTPAQVHAYSITLFHPYSLEFTSKTVGVGRRKCPLSKFSSTAQEKKKVRDKE
jgi:hypothetical protein